MAFTGKYEIESQENYDEFVRLLGLSEDIVQKGRDIKQKVEVEQNGDDFTWTKVFPLKSWTNKFTIGKESELETMAGLKFKTTVTMDEGKMRIQFPLYAYTAEIQGDKLIETASSRGIDGTVTMKRTYKRV